MHSLRNKTLVLFTHDDQLPVIGDFHVHRQSEKLAYIIIIIIELYNFSGHSLTLELNINRFLSLCGVCILGFLVLNCFLLSHSLPWGVKWGGGLSWELLTPREVQIIMLLIVLGSVVIQDTSSVKVHVNPQCAENIPNPNLLFRRRLACTFMGLLSMITHPDCVYPHFRFCMKVLLPRQRRLPDEH